MSTMPALPEPSILATPSATTITFRSPHTPRHRKQMSPLDRDLNDTWCDRWIKQGLGEAHVARHRLDVGVES